MQRKMALSSELGGSVLFPVQSDHYGVCPKVISHFSPIEIRTIPNGQNHAPPYFFLVLYPVSLKNKNYFL